MHTQQHIDELQQQSQAAAHRQQQPRPWHAAVSPCPAAAATSPGCVAAPGHCWQMRCHPAGKAKTVSAQARTGCVVCLHCPAGCPQGLLALPTRMHEVLGHALTTAGCASCALPSLDPSCAHTFKQHVAAADSTQQEGTAAPRVLGRQAATRAACCLLHMHVCPRLERSPLRCPCPPAHTAADAGRRAEQGPSDLNGLRQQQRRGCHGSWYHKRHKASANQRRAWLPASGPARAAATRTAVHCECSSDLRVGVDRRCRLALTSGYALLIVLPVCECLFAGPAHVAKKGAGREIDGLFFCLRWLAGCSDEHRSSVCRLMDP